MTSVTFWLLLSQNVWLYVLSLLICILIYSIIINKIVRSIIDPVLWVMITAIFANSVPLFLFFIKEIDTKVIVYISVVELSFWLTYFFTRRKRIVFSQYKMKNSIITDNIYILFFFICVLCHLLTYYKFGIPLLKESRLETYSSGGGWGILSYFQNFSVFYTSIYSFFLLKNRRMIIFARIVVVSILFFMFLSGSKAAILTLVHAYFFYLYYYENRAFEFKKFRRFIPLVILFPIIVIMKQSGGNIWESIFSVFSRFVANGDVYWMSFPNNVIDSVEINNPIQYLFSRVLGPFRLIDYSTLDQNIGVQLYWEIYPDQYGLIKGPNSRLPILCWIYGGIGGFLLSVIFGYLCALWHTRLICLFPKGILSVIVYGYIYNSLCAMFVDPINGTGYIFSIVLFILTIISLYVLLGKTKIRLNGISERDSNVYNFGMQK